MSSLANTLRLLWSGGFGFLNQFFNRTDPEPISVHSSFRDNALVRAVNVSKGSVLATKIQWAGTSESRRRGLLGRNRIKANEGMYIVPTQWIHMFGMQFPIDVAFLDADGRVLCIHHSLQPNRLSRLVWRAEGALELVPGTLQATDTSVGDYITLQ